MRLLILYALSALAPTFAAAQSERVPASVQQLMDDQKWASSEPVAALYEPYLHCVRRDLEAASENGPVVRGYDHPLFEKVFEACGIGELPIAIRVFAHEPNQGLSKEVADRRTNVLLAMIQIWSFSAMREFFPIPEDRQADPDFRIEGLMPVQRDGTTEESQ